MGSFFSGLRAVVLLACCYLRIIGVAEGQRDRMPTRFLYQDSLLRFLRDFDNDKSTRYVAAFRDINDDGVPEAVVYLTGSEWCGTGGCITLILKQDRATWKIITKMSITRPPIRILATTSHGWRDVGVWVQGGGIQPGYEAELRFDGKTYPENPSVPPAHRTVKRAEGEVVVASMNGRLLFPKH